MNETAPDPTRVARARRLRVFRRTLGFVRLACTVLALAALYGIGWVPALAAALAPAGAIVQTLVTIAVVLVAVWLVGLPFAIAFYRRERDEGLSVQGGGGFAVDQVKALALSVVLIGAASAAWYAVAPLPAWWLFAAIGAFALAALATLIGPLLLRAFYRLDPIDEALAGRVRAVAARSGVRVDRVLSWRVSEKATIANAAVLGLGPTKQIVIADTLAANRPPEQVEAVVAHELAHVVHRDTLRGFLVYGASLAFAVLLLRALLDALTARGAADPATFPLLVAGIELIALAVSPLVLAYSRSREAAADRFAARHSTADDLGRALVWTTSRNLADPDPPRWEEVLFMSHPSLSSRLRALGQPTEASAASR
jgi:STE24 endopeptidase